MKMTAARTRAQMALVACAVTVAVAGCSTASPDASGDGDSELTITLVRGVNGDPFYQTMSCGAQYQADLLGVTLVDVGADQWAADAQTPVLNSVVAQHPDAILIAPVDKTAMAGPLREAANQGIKVVIVDTGLDDESMAVSVISSDNELGGRLAADALGELIGGEGSVFVMNVKTGISTTDLRAQGFLDEMATKYPNVEILETQYNDDDASKAAEITTAQLAAHPDLAGIFATNVLGAEGTATGLKQAGKQGAVALISYDAGPKQVEDLEAGVVQGLVAQDPYTEGVEAVKQAYAALTGGTVEATVKTELAAITLENIEANAQYLYKDHC